MRIPFAPGAHAYFHACRTGRWFAPFFARTFGVHAHGHHGYTTVSTSPDRFTWEPLRLGGAGPLYLIACPGKQSHGLSGALTKYLGARAVPMEAYGPRSPGATPRTTPWRRSTTGRSPTFASGATSGAG